MIKVLPQCLVWLERVQERAQEIKREFKRESRERERVQERESSREGEKVGQTHKEEETLGSGFKGRKGCLWLHAMEDGRAKVDVHDAEEVNGVKGDANEEDKRDLPS